MRFQPEQLKKAMTDSHMSAIALANATGLTRFCIHKLLNGSRQNPSMNTVVLCSRATGKPVDFFYADPTQPTEQE